MTKWPKVWIVVLNYNGGRLIENCLKSLKKINYRDAKILVVDNNSQDDSIYNIKEKFSEVAVLENKKNLGFSAGNNVGIKYALKNGADYVLLLNQDTEVEADFLTKLIQEALKNDLIGMLSPVILQGKSRKNWFSGGRINWFNMRTYHRRKSIKKPYFKSDFLTGCSLLVKREVFQKIGLLDEKFFLYWEDVDFSVRAKEVGFKVVVVPNSTVYHFETSEILNKDKVYWLVFSGLIFFQKNTPWFFCPWLKFFIGARKIKNWLELKNNKKELAIKVNKAYKDFQDVKL